MKLGGLGLPAYRTFSLEELEEATNNFNTSTFMGEGSHGQVFWHFNNMCFVYIIVSFLINLKSCANLLWSLMIEKGWWFASTLIQMYRGRLRDGSSVAIRCLKLKRNHSTQYFMPHIEMISKLRHQHLVSALGHCFEYYLDDSSVSRVFLVFEYVPNGTLRSWISGKSKLSLILCTRLLFRCRLSWLYMVVWQKGELDRSLRGVSA